jgi:hypothetical protein
MLGETYLTQSVCGFDRSRQSGVTELLQVCIVDEPRLEGGLTEPPAIEKTCFALKQLEKIDHG